MKKIKEEKTEDYEINGNDSVTVEEYEDGNRKILTNCKTKATNLINVKRLTKDEYMILETGEIKRYLKNRYKTKENLKVSLSKLKKILNNNFCGDKSELFITLTCKEQVSDYETIVNYFSKFWDKLKRKYNELEYVYVVELQEERNSWHIHCLIKDKKNKNLYIENEEIEKVYLSSEFRSTF